MESTDTPRRSRRRARRSRKDTTPLLPVLVFAVIILLKLYATRATALADANPLRALWLEGGFVLLLLAAAALLPRGRHWAWLAIDVVLSLACVAVIVYVREFDQAPTLAALGRSRELGGVGLAVGDRMHPAFLAFFVEVPVLAWLFATPVRGRARRREQWHIDARLGAALVASAVWIAVVMVSLGSAGPIDDATAGARAKGMLAYALYQPGERELAEPVTSSAEATRTAAVATSGAGPATETLLPAPRHPRKLAKERVDLKDPASVQRRFDELQGFRGSSRVAGAPKPGAYKGSSVIVIQMESLGRWVTEAKVGDREITPNFNELVEESWYAPRVVTQIGPGNTSDAEFTANTSLLADRNQPASYVYGEKRIPSLPRLAAKKGYESLTFHTNVIGFWRRDLLYPALGFSRWYARPDFPRTDVVDGIGSSDPVLYRKVSEVVSEKRKGRKKYVAEVITLAAHSPYLGASKRSELEIPAELRGTSLGNYVRAIHYQDDKLGDFVEQLKRDGVWDDTPVVIYGDHFGVRPVGGSSIALTDAEKEAIRRMLGRRANWEDTYQVPILIHLPGQKKPERIDGLRAQVDIMPTIAELLGLKLSRTPHIGASVFDDRPRVATMRYHMPNGTFMTDDYLFRPGMGFDDGKVKMLPGGKRPKKSDAKLAYERVKALIEFNELYLESLPRR